MQYVPPVSKVSIDFMQFVLTKTRMIEAFFAGVYLGLLIVGLTIISLAFTFGYYAKGAELSCDTQRQPIYCAIKAIKPSVDNKFALQLSNYISRYSKKYGTDPFRTVAIIAQESMFQNIHRKQQVILFKLRCNEENICVEYTQLAEGYTDIGLYQFHALTVQAHGIDSLRLRDDLEYATERHTWLLAEKIKLCRNLGILQEAWSCYHSATPKHRELYVKLVNRYYNKIKRPEMDVGARQGH